MLAYVNGLLEPSCKRNGNIPDDDLDTAIRAVTLRVEVRAVL
jgi:hypothetical protein